MANELNSGCTSDCSTCGGCDDGQMTVTLTLDDDSALLPTNPPEGEEGEVYLYRFVTMPDGSPNLENIESDEEYEIVSDAFEELLDAAEFDELVTEEEEE